MEPALIHVSNVYLGSLDQMVLIMVQSQFAVYPLCCLFSNLAVDILMRTNDGLVRNTSALSKYTSHRHNGL